MASKSDRNRDFCDTVLDHPKYTEYIQNHLEDLQSKCDHLTICINKLLSQQSPISVLKGDNLGLDKICELINVKGNNSAAMFDGKCSLPERLDIRQDVENHLKDKMEKKHNWESVDVCLENNYGDNERTTYVADLCGLVERKGRICTYNTHKQVERFVNEQIDHLQCTCKALHEEHEHAGLDTVTFVAIGAGALLLICVILALAYFCHRRNQRKKKKRKGPSVIYLPAANSDNYPVYQEIFDQRSPPLNPPTLPGRYNSRPLPGHPDETEYLEPVQAQAASSSYRAKAPPPLQRLVNNPGYTHAVDAPPEYTETDQTYEDATFIDPSEVNAYFEPVVTPKSEKTGEEVGEGGGGYDTLDVRENNRRGDEDGGVDGASLPGEYQPLHVRENKENNNRGGDEEDDDDDECDSLPDEYQPLEDIGVVNNSNSNKDRKLGPTPGQRTKKDDRLTESEYFELERVESDV